MLFCFGILVITGNTFSCLSDGSKIPPEFVNDGFCDCVDGSDESETHLFNEGVFQCKNEVQNDG